MPVIAMTARALENDREKCLQAGMDAYVSKPLLIDDLAAVLEEMTSKFDLSAAPAEESAGQEEHSGLPQAEVFDKELMRQSVRRGFRIHQAGHGNIYARCAGVGGRH